VSAHVRLTTRAPSPVSVRGSGAGGMGNANLRQAVHAVASAGISRIAAQLQGPVHGATTLSSAELFR